MWRAMHTHQRHVMVWYNRLFTAVRVVSAPVLIGLCVVEGWPMWSCLLWCAEHQSSYMWI